MKAAWAIGIIGSSLLISYMRYGLTPLKNLEIWLYGQPIFLLFILVGLVITMVRIWNDLLPGDDK